MKKVQVNEFVTKSPWSLSIRARVRFSDPREMQVDLTADYLITKDHPDKSASIGKEEEEEKESVEA